MSSYRDLLDQIAALENEAKAVRELEVSKAIQHVWDVVAKYHLTAADIFPPPSKSKQFRVIRFQHPETGQSWVGIGKKPNWVKAAEAAGIDINSFRITSDAGQPLK